MVKEPLNKYVEILCGLESTPRGNARIQHTYQRILKSYKTLLQTITLIQK